MMRTIDNPEYINKEGATQAAGSEAQGESAILERLYSSVGLCAFPRLFWATALTAGVNSSEVTFRNSGLTIMYAVIETGGKQYRVAPGQTLELDTIAGDVGTMVEFERVLALSNESNELLLGDSIGGAKVLAKITEHGRAAKVIVFKFKRKKQYKRTQGHRQNFTRVRVEEILAS